MRLIDADLINNRLIEMCKPQYDKKRQFDLLTTLAIAEFIQNPQYVPTVDAVPVVRCKKKLMLEESTKERMHPNVYILYVNDEEGAEVVQGVFSEYEYAQSFADDHLDEWYRIEERTLNLG